MGCTSIFNSYWPNWLGRGQSRGGREEVLEGDTIYTHTHTVNKHYKDVFVVVSCKMVKESTWSIVCLSN